MNRVAICMCTFNGQKYLLNQLASFAAQNYLPNDVIICDDRSHDHAKELIESFAKKSPFSTHLYINKERLGVSKNFEKAISLCSGDIIFLSDQDDVWYPDKIAKIEAVFANYPEVGAVFTDAEVVDENLKRLGYNLWQPSGFNKAKQNRMKKGQAIEVLLQSNIVTGATLAFRANLKDLILPIPSNAYHDAWIALVVAFTSKLAFLEEPLIKYRQHSHNQVGGLKKNILEKISQRKQQQHIHQNLLEQFIELRQRLSTHPSANFSPQALKKLDEKINHLTVRTQLSQKRLKRLLPTLQELIHLNYHRYSSGLFSFLRDLLL